MGKLSERISSIREQVGATYVRPDPEKLKKFREDLATNEVAMAYLEATRGLTKDTIDHFQLGYDSYRDAIAIPVFKRGELVNIKYRFLKPEKIKYSGEKDAESWIFHEEGIKNGIAKKSVIIVEGEFDLMSVWQTGSINVVSPSAGKEAFGVWIEYLDSIPRIYIAYDNDAPGKDASSRLAERLGTEKCLEVIYPEGTKDANEFFRKYTKEDWVALAKSARPYYTHQFKGLGDVIKSLREKKGKLLKSSFIPGVEIEPNAQIVISGVTNVGKCHGRGTKILMHDGSIKLVEDVIVGDKLMGPDSKPRTVNSLARGVEEMFRVWERGEYYDANGSHILSLQMQRNGETQYLEKTINEFNSYEKSRQRFMRGWKTGVDFPEQEVSLDPYILGMWLGDGSAAKPQITTENIEIEDSIMLFAKSRGLSVTKATQKNNNSCTFDIVNRSRKARSNSFLNNLKDLNVYKNKHIPEEYKRNSEKNRLELLAGLIDTDGCSCKTERGACYEIIQKSERLSNDITYLARSLGYRVVKNKCTKSIKSIGFTGTYYRMFIVGDLGRIPLRIGYKKSSFIPKKKWLTSNIEIEPLGIGDYYGFTLDSDGLYLLGNFTVTHNTGYILNIADEWSRVGLPTLVLPFERGVETVGARFLQVKFNKDRNELTSQDDRAWRNITDECLDLPLYFAKPDFSEVYDFIIKAKRIFDIKVVVIDHLDYLIRSVQNKEAAIGDTLKRLHDIGDEHGIIMLIVTHVRKLDAPGGWVKPKKPGLDDLKGSSSLSQDPEIVIMLSSEEKGTIHVDVLKNKGAMGYMTYNVCERTGKITGEYDEYIMPKDKQEEIDF